MATYEPHVAPYPVHVEGHLERPSRWLWLFKWLLALPHYFVLAFLWLAMFVCSLAAFVAVLFTGRYPRSLFEFNVGVLRWSWRVAFYAYGANGTDRYPPFTLGEAPAYPARLEVEYPQRQRRGLPLIGWWLAGIPQYLIAGILLGGGGGAGWTLSHGAWARVPSIGLIGLLVLVAVVVLLFKGAYPRSIFDLVLGLNRWVLRVVAYAAVMTPEYPPFRVDPGELDPAGVLSVGAAGASEAAWPGSGPVAGAPARRWGAGRVIAVVASSLACLLALAAIAAGAAGLVFDGTQRDSAGYLMTSPSTYWSPTYALVSESYTTGAPADLSLARDVLGKVRIVTRSSTPVFVGVAPEAAANAYLAGVERSEAPRLDSPSSDFRLRAGGAPPAPPSAQRFWVASSTGGGTHVLTWRPTSGSWRIVVMNADARRNVAAEISAGASFPHLEEISLAVLGAGLLLAAAGAAGLYLALRRAR